MARLRLLQRCFVLAVVTHQCTALYDAVNHIASCRIYGNIDKYAYYFVDLTVGSPSQRVSVIVDTGSGLTAFPCQSCKHCGSHIDPAYDFKKSSSAKWKKCGRGCPGQCKSGHCSYYQGYTEGSSISGWWFEDLLRLGDTLQHNPPVVASMGCHQDETNLFFTQKANGIMGIRPPSPTGVPTVLQQLFAHREHINQDVFSLCFAEWGGRLTVGGYNQSYHAAGSKIDYVPLQTKSGFYKVALSGMVAGGVKITSGFGSTMIDSGTTYSYFSANVYNSLKRGIEEACTGKKCGATRSVDCWLLEKANDLSKFPTIQVSFGNVQTSWVAKGYLYRKGSSNRWCYSFQNDGPGANSVLGASWMIHQDIIFDMPKARVGIVKANCPEFDKRPVHTAEPDRVAAAVPQAGNGQKLTLPTTGLRVPIRPAEVQHFNVGLVWAGLAVGICTATGVMGITLAVCKKVSTGDEDMEKKPKKTATSARSPKLSKMMTQTVGAADEEEEDPLVGEQPTRGPRLSVEG
eukprot:TRINITY_DN7039_c0_g1_i1.p1 TRINITY_DN7039_c0_g1~~TRINITY_DN7039_c0_g1_i1.p1  ORF type:complete len:544 (+),score=61.57 TRINITY_DN7039_c0_g1_i1:86-1633(+)